MMQLRTENRPFKPRARLLLLLGDQLIRDPGIAVFELVKNAYDADSPFVKLTMTNITDKDNGKIIIEDAGTGMDYDTITSVWLEPGTDYRNKQKELKELTLKYKRLPIGEKGVGRFASHKLGKRIKLVTRKKDNPEIVVDINWDEFSRHEYMDQVPVTIMEREPNIFQNQNTGTIIEITRLRDIWNKRMIRDLYRSVNSICSPFDTENNFKIDLIIKDHDEWLKGLLSIKEVLEYALFRSKCEINGRKLKYEYEFQPYPAMDKVKGRKTNKEILISENEEINLKQIEQYVGKIKIDSYIYDRSPAILNLGVTDKKGLKEFLDTSGGLRVYRDGIRVYDYGEPGNDWLNLGTRRVNIPTRRISNNIIAGSVSINMENSMNKDPDGNYGLIDKTNREGFVENETYKAFLSAVLFAITQIEVERNEDKERIRIAYSSKKLKEPVIEDLSELRDIIIKKKMMDELGPYLDRIEEDYTLIRDRYLTSASAGLSLAVVIHEVEKGIEELKNAVRIEKVSTHIKELAIHLADLVQGFAALIKRSGISREKASSLINRAVSNMRMRLDAHKINLEINLNEYDFDVKCSRRLTITTIMNLIDNSIWWLHNKWGIAEKRKKLYIGTSREFSYGPAIVIADNGPGFIDSPDILVEPFISRKPDGSGLGLHLADQVMKGQGGKLEFPENNDLNLPSYCKGAIVALVFGEKKS